MVKVTEQEESDWLGDLSLQHRLSLLQNELHVPKSNAKPGLNYTYRTAEEIMVAVKPLLLKYHCSLTVSDIVRSTEGSMVLDKYVDGKAVKEVHPKVRVLYIHSIATLACTIDLKDAITACASAGVTLQSRSMSDAQSYGSASSYARKYALSGLFLLDDNKDPDDRDEEPKAKVAKVPKPKVEAPVHPIIAFLNSLPDEKKEPTRAAIKTSLVTFGKAKLQELTDAQVKEILSNLKEVNR